MLLSGSALAQAPIDSKDSAAPAAAERSVRLPAPTQTAPGLPTVSAAGEVPVGPAPTTAVPPVANPVSDDMVYLNVQDQEITDVIRQISKATKRNFIIDGKVKGKVTIISEKMMTREEAYQAFLSALEVAGFTVVSGPAGMLKLVALKDAASSPIPIHVDTTPYTDSFITRLVTMENISALDMSNAIKGLISKDGNLMAYPATNTLIITDSGTNIDRLMKIIKELDQEGPQQTVEIIPIHYADAKQVASMVLNLFESASGGASRAGAATSTRARAGAAAGGDAPSDVKEVSKIIADDRTNSLIVVASKRALDRVHDIIARLDTRIDEGGSGSVHVHYLKYANAKEMASTLSSITSGVQKTKKASGGNPNAPAEAEAPSVANLEGGVNVGADESTNALIITASPKDYQVLVDELISKLDIPRKQVYLESMIMELSMRKSGDYGLKGFGGLGLGSLLGFGQTFGALGGLSNTFGGNNGMVGGIIGRDTVDVTIPTVTSSGVTSNTVSLPAFSAFLNLIQTYADSNVVSSPNILTVDNEEAEINITEKQYAKKTTTTATGFQSSEPTPLEAGLILKITPQINEGNSVKLKIEQELSNFTGPPDPDSGAAPSAKRKINTTVITQDGETVVLGGLMQDNVSHSKSKVPGLGDVPLLGFLFRNSSSITSKNNLLVFITPYVIRDPSDFSSVMKRKIEERNRFVDDNFGARQRAAIRKTIARHRAELLNYVPPPEAPKLTSQEQVGKPLPALQQPVLAPTPNKSVSDQSAASAASQNGVITVPSVDSSRAGTVNPTFPGAKPNVPASNSAGKPKVQPPAAPYQQNVPAPADLDLAY